MARALVAGAGGHLTEMDRRAGVVRPVRIGCAALESTLAAHLGRTTTRPLALGACLDLTRPAGANWARLVRLLATEALAHRAYVAAI